MLTGKALEPRVVRSGRLQPSQKTGNTQGAFTLAQFRTKLAHLEMKNIFYYFAKRASLMRNRVRKSLM
jgi:hypothetical protein